MANRVQFMHGTMSEAEAADELMLRGEIGVVFDDDNADITRMKVGDGIRTWNELPYMNVGPQGPSGAIVWDVDGGVFGDPSPPEMTINAGEFGDE